jgi:intracellular multiplication protein IcmJ
VGGLRPLALGAYRFERVEALLQPVSSASCGYCGIGPTKFQLALSDTAACPLCSACLTLNRPRIEEEFALIRLPDTPQAPWLPRVSQADINDLARACHMIFHAHGEPPHMQQRPKTDTPALRHAYRAFRSLLTLIPGAAGQLDTTSPRDLGAVLTSLAGDPDKRRMAEPHLRNVRLLPLGHLYQNGRDIYPEVLDAWLAHDGPCAGLVS